MQVPAQDYEKIRRHCLRDGTKFEDPYFPADDRSLFYSQKLPFTPVWKRPGVSTSSLTNIGFIIAAFFDNNMYVFKELITYSL